MSVKEILSQSSNIGTITIAQKMGPGELASWIDRFGFGKPTGIDYPGESSGLVLPLVVLAPSTLGAEYASWLALLRLDHANRGWSIVTIVRDSGGSTAAVQLGACALAALPMLGALVVPVDEAYRRRTAAALLVLLVLCNHRSEYASFVISAIGVGLWFAEGRATPARIALLALATVAHGPVFVRDDPALTGALSFLAAHRMFHPLRLVPLILVWALLQATMLKQLYAGVDRAARAGVRA